MSSARDRDGGGPVAGVCSWSLRPRTPEELAERAAAVGVRAVQLALDPVRDGRMPLGRTFDALGSAGIEVRSGMMAMRGEDYSTPESIRRTGGVRPDEHWTANLAAAREDAALAERLGLRLVSFHAGFLPEDRRDPERGRMVERLRALADVYGERGARVALETGQETAATLLDVLDELDHPSVGVNFDPANMLLYGTGDPVEALELLAPRVLQVHVKDARPPRAPGEWGEEVPAGTGEVDWRAFFDVLLRDGVPRDLVIEREAGDDRVGDARRALELVARMVG